MRIWPGDGTGILTRLKIVVLWVRIPLWAPLQNLMGGNGSHQVVLASNLVFDAGKDVVEFDISTRTVHHKFCLINLLRGILL